MPGDKSLTRQHVNCLSVLCYPSLMSGFGHCFSVGGRPLCQLSRDFCNQRTMEHGYDWLDMDMDIDMDRHGRQALWGSRFLVDKLTAHSLMDGLPWRSMHESLDLWRHVMMYKEVQTYARFLQWRSELRMISSMMFRIVHDFATTSNITNNRCKLVDLLTLPVSRPKCHRCTSPPWCLFYW